MNKKIVAIFLTIIMVLTALPTFAATETRVLLCETFENYKTNTASIGSNVKISTGIDGRVIKEANGNKAAYTKAWGESGKINVSFLASDERKMVYSARIKLSGANTSGKLFSLSDGKSTIDFLTLSESGSVTLPGGKHIGGAPRGRWITYTVMVDWGKGTYSVYADGKCKASKIYLPKGAYLDMTSLTVSVSEPDADFTELFVDDIKVYEGDKLPEKVSFPPVAYNNEEDNFEPTLSLDIVPSIFYSNDFTSGSGAISVVSGGCKVTHTKEGENGYLLLSAEPAATSSTYFDISCSDLANEQKYVMSVDFKVNEILGSSSRISLFDGKDGSGAWRMGISLYASGIVDNQTKNQLAKYTVGEWHNIALCYNTGEGTYDFYYDDELLSEGVQSKAISPIIFRVDLINSLGGKLNVNLDNFRFYKGKKPIGEEEYQAIISGDDAGAALVTTTSIVDYTADAVKYIGENSVFMHTNNKMFANGKKIDYPGGYTPYFANGNFMVTPQILEEVGISAKYNEQNGEINISDGKIIMSAGSDTMLANGKEIKMPAEVQSENDNIYIPFRSLFADGLGKSIYYDARGFVVLSDTPFEYTDSNVVQDVFQPIDSIFKYMQFENPSSAQIISDAQKVIGNAHPRILYTSDDVNYILDRLDSGDTAWKTLYKNLLADADSRVGKSISASPEEGSKQNTASSYEGRMRVLSTAYLLTGDDKYAECIMQNLVAACSWNDFGERTALLTNGDWMLGTAFAFDSIYPYLLQHKEEFEFIKAGIKRIAIEPIKKAYRGENGLLRWIQMTDNFTGFIAGGAVCLCLSLINEEGFEEDCGYLLENLIKTLQIPITIFAPDGAWFEGVSYGYYGLFHMADAFTGFVNTCGSEYGLTSARGIDRAADWYIYASTPQSSFTFHDMAAGTVTKTWCGYDIAYIRGDLERMEATKRFMSLCGTNLNIPSLLRYEKAITNKGITVNIDNLPLDHYFKTADAGTFYNSLTTEKPTFVGFHGGWTGLPHDMLDLGSFMFISDGVVWGYDMGSDDYNLSNYFGLKGYRHYRKNTQGENVLTINPADDRENYWGQSTSAYAPLIRYETKERGALSAYDLTEAYGRDVKEYVRGYYFGDNRNTLTVRDELTLKKKSEIYWAMHTKADIEILDNNTAILKMKDETLKAEVVCSKPGFELKVMDAVLLPNSPGLDVAHKAYSTEGIRKLVIYYPEVDGELDITVKLSPQNNKYIETPIDASTDISAWTLPDGSITEPLSLSEIRVDGKMIEDFYADKTEYKIILPFGTETVPNITATAKVGNAVVIPAANVYEKTIIRIEKEGYHPIEIKISFISSTDRDINVTEALSGAEPAKGTLGTLIKPLRATASKVDDEKHGLSNLLDDNFETRCAASGIVWFEVDFGEVIDINGVSISFYDGDLRKQKYDLLYSEDGVNYKRVFSGNSLGTTTDYESVAAPGRVRYIRFAGYGNSSSNWNSVTEIRAYK